VIYNGRKTYGATSQKSHALPFPSLAPDLQEYTLGIRIAKTAAKERSERIRRDRFHDHRVRLQMAEENALQRRTKK
jgi:hypothetical protein